jgi:hypothetical protein
MPIGRPTLLTRVIVGRAAQLIETVQYVETVAALLGINRRTFQRWLRDGARIERRVEGGDLTELTNDELLRLDFCRAVKKGLAQAEHDALERIGMHSLENWQANAWLLERRHPERWGSDRAEMRKLARRAEELTKKLDALTGAKSAEATGPG